MVYKIQILYSAKQGILEIYNYYNKNVSKIQANSILSKIEEKINSLSHLPYIGHTPIELLRINIKLYQEVHISIYRILYQVIDQQVFIFAVLDSRREIQELLERRLLR